MFFAPQHINLLLQINSQIINKTNLVKDTPELALLAFRDQNLSNLIDVTLPFSIYFYLDDLILASEPLSIFKFLSLIHITSPLILIS